MANCIVIVQFDLVAGRRQQPDVVVFPTQHGVLDAGRVFHVTHLERVAGCRFPVGSPDVVVVTPEVEL